ncbi:MAG: FtsQ-type POTRA domain-containing protein [Akkermansia sp.]
MARKSTAHLSSESKRKEMRLLEKTLAKSGFKPQWWKHFFKTLYQLFILAVIFCVLGWGIKLLWCNYISTYDGLVAKYVEFRSNGVISKHQILEIMGIQGKESLFSLDVNELEKKLLTCPSISRATVTRELPSTLIVEVDARLPIAWLDCPQVGVRAHDLDRGYFIDSDGCVFPCSQNIHTPYVHNPVLQIPAPASGEIHPGNILESAKNAVGLIILLRREESKTLPKVQRLIVPNEWSYIVELEDGCHAVFGIYDLARQVDNFLLILQNAAKDGKKVAHINLIPERNVPVIYVKSKQEEANEQKDPEPPVVEKTLIQETPNKAPKNQVKKTSGKSNR